MVRIRGQALVFLSLHYTTIYIYSNSVHGFFIRHTVLECWALQTLVCLYRQINHSHYKMYKIVHCKRLKLDSGNHSHDKIAFPFRFARCKWLMLDSGNTPDVSSLPVKCSRNRSSHFRVGKVESCRMYCTKCASINTERSLQYKTETMWVFVFLLSSWQTLVGAFSL